MKKGIHPAYGPVVFRDCGGDYAFLTRSAASHPFWTGKQRTLDTAGRIERFNARYATHRP